MQRGESVAWAFFVREFDSGMLGISHVLYNHGRALLVRSES